MGGDIWGIYNNTTKKKKRENRRREEKKKSKEKKSHASQSRKTLAQKYSNNARNTQNNTQVDPSLPLLISMKEKEDEQQRKPRRRLFSDYGLRLLSKQWKPSRSRRECVIWISIAEHNALEVSILRSSCRQCLRTKTATCVKTRA